MYNFNSFKKCPAIKYTNKVILTLTDFVRVQNFKQKASRLLKSLISDVIVYSELSDLLLPESTYFLAL